MQRRAADFVGIAETQVLLDQLEQVAPATVRQMVPKPLTVTQLSDILRRLVEEGVSARDLKGILEALAQVAHLDKDPLNLTEYVRAQMRRSLTHQFTAGRRELSVHLLDSQIEETIRAAISRTSAGSFLTLAPAAGRDIVNGVRRALSQTQETDVPRVILTQPDIRRFVRKLIELDLPEVKVISYAELLPEIAIKPLSRATIAGL
jgi:type III secretion protein V